MLLQLNGKLVLGSCVVILGWTASLQLSLDGIRAVVVTSKPREVRQPSGVLSGWGWGQLFKLYSRQVCQQLEGPPVEGDSDSIPPAPRKHFSSLFIVLFPSSS